MKALNSRKIRVGLFGVGLAVVGAGAVVGTSSAQQANPPKQVEVPPARHADTPNAVQFAGDLVERLGVPNVTVLRSSSQGEGVEASYSAELAGPDGSRLSAITARLPSGLDKKKLAEIAVPGLSLYKVVSSENDVWVLVMEDPTVITVKVVDVNALKMISVIEHRKLGIDSTALSEIAVDMLSTSRN